MEVSVSLVGAGPGDPALLTLAAVRALERADVVLYDALVHPAVLGRARADAEKIFVGKRAGHEGISQGEINAMLVAFARDGRRVCRLKGGDPFLFGRGSEEAEVLAREGISFEVVPGVTAALGATAYAGISLTHRALSSSVAFLTSSEHASKSTSAHDWSKLATATQTLVIFMGVRKIGEEMSRLMEFGRAPETPVAVIQWGTRADQRVVIGTVEDIARRVEEAQLGAPALVVIGEVARLRETLHWWDDGPLFGRRVLVTRAREQSAGLLEALAERGAEPVSFPAIAFAAPTDPTLLDRALGRVATYDLAVFTSVNGVDRWFAAMRARRLDSRAFARARIVAIGPATASALEKHGILADVIPGEHRGEAAVTAAFGLFETTGGIAGKRVLLARAEVAREVIPEALREAGAEVDVVPVYRTLSATERDVESLVAALRGGQIDAALFTSSSTVEHVCDALGPDAASLLAPVAIASIGPITSETARSRGLHVSVEAATYTVPGLLAALERHYTRTETP